MCGIAGFLDPDSRLTHDAACQVAEAMGDRLVHRGPDESGIWVDARSGIALAHRRLSILDLTPTGRQPMRSASSRFVLVLNGEIYNFRQLRRTLQQLGHAFRGTSDTEVMLAAFEQWGVEGSLPRFNGMFAFAVWDAESRTLTLARDRVGEKPLYYGWMGAALLFASELKALRAVPDFHPEIDVNVLALYLRYGYIPSPYSIYAGVAKLAPGTFLKVAVGRPQSPVAYWSARAVAEEGVANPFTGSAAEATDELERLLRDAVTLQMVADVPVGAFLSGGIDSSTVVALMQAQSTRPVRTFTIGFKEPRFDEAQPAKLVAAHLGTDHTELYVTPGEAIDVIPRLPQVYDEPFADSSQIPTLLLAQLTRRHVTVSLSGDAGDELFWGYQRYLLCQRLSRVLRLPRRGRAAVARLLDSRLGALADPLLQLGRVLGSNYPPPTRVAAMRERLAELLSCDGPASFYRGIMSSWKSPCNVVPGSAEPPTAATHGWSSSMSVRHNVSYLDLMSYLPDDILVKVDRAAMAVSLETRIPLLDHRVVEFAARIPPRFKAPDAQGKWLLRQVLYRYVPASLVNRRKTGFGVPIAAWLRGPLRDWAESLLDQRRLQENGYLDPTPVRQAWAEHLSGRRDWHSQLWSVLMLQGWLQQERRAAPAYAFNKVTCSTPVC